MESVEASGKSIEDAILQALARLGRNRNEVEITVLQEPSRGVRGMGAREARVRVHVKPAYAIRPAPELADEGEEEYSDDEALTDEAAYGDEFDAEYAEEEAEPALPFGQIPTTPL